MPEWMLEALKQSPTLAICLGVVYFAWKHNQGIHNRYLESLEKANATHLSSKDAEIQRQREDLDTARKERDTEGSRRGEGETMSEYWIVQLINAGIILVFGCFLMWQSSLSVQRRAASLFSGSANGPENPVLIDKQRRMQALKAELSQLERELADVSSNSSVATGA